MKEKISTDWDGKPRKVFALNCFVCNTEFWVPKHVIQKDLCCSHECGNKKRRNREKVNCSYCKKEIERTPSKKLNSRSGHYFCNRKCKESAQTLGPFQIEEIQPEHYGLLDGASAYRLRALRSLDNVCNMCQYSENVKMLDVHHIDGDRSNGNLENLQILCVWCHALTTRKVKLHKRG